MARSVPQSSGSGPETSENTTTTKNGRIYGPHRYRGALLADGIKVPAGRRFVIGISLIICAQNDCHCNALS